MRVKNRFNVRAGSNEVPPEVNLSTEFSNADVKTLSNSRRSIGARLLRIGGGSWIGGLKTPRSVENALASSLGACDPGGDAMAPLSGKFKTSTAAAAHVGW